MGQVYEFYAQDRLRPMHGSRRHVGETGIPGLASVPAYSLGQLVAAGADLRLRCRRGHHDAEVICSASDDLCSRVRDRRSRRCRYRRVAGATCVRLPNSPSGTMACASFGLLCHAPRRRFGHSNAVDNRTERPRRTLHCAKK
jgi:hypothetical protein